jgi:hypothetical protein
MKKTLADLFIATRGKPIIYEGRVVHGAAFRHMAKAGRFIVRFVKAIPKPVQALRIDIDPGRLVIAGEESRKMILRLDTCPDVVEVRYRLLGLGSTITFYNAWIDEKGVIDAWLMNAGMLVEETGNRMLLRCSDGRGEPTFDDLIVEIEFLDD